MENSFFLFKRIEFVHSVLHIHRTLFKKLASISKKNIPSIPNAMLPNLTYTLDLRYIYLNTYCGKSHNLTFGQPN